MSNVLTDIYLLKTILQDFSKSENFIIALDKTPTIQANILYGILRLHLSRSFPPIQLPAPGLYWTCIQRRPHPTVSL